MPSIYLDNQATTAIDPRVMEAMLAVGFGNPHSSEHAVGWEAHSRVEAAKEEVAALIGAEGDEIFFTSGATEANNLAILGVRKSQRSGKDRVARSTIEHKSVLAACDALADEYGFTVDSIPVDARGFVDMPALSNAVTSATALVSIAMVNNEIGTIQDIQAIRNVCRGTLFHCDAAQAPGAGDLSGVADQCDLLSLSAHKMHGPMGIGALYISRAVQRAISPILYGGGQQNGMRPGTLPVHLCVGMGVACRLAADGASHRARTARLRDEFLSHLAKTGLTFSLNGPDEMSRRHAGNANLQIPGADAEQLIAMLQPTLAISSGSACTSGTMEPSYVLTSVGLTPDEASSSIRVSFGTANTETEAQTAAQMIVEAYARLA